MPKKKRVKAGTPPGTIIFSGTKKVSEVSVHYLEYNKDVMSETAVAPGEFIEFHSPNDGVMQWYDVRGLHDTQLIENFGKVCKIHPLVLEDIADIYQRPKFEEYDDGIFISLKAVFFNVDTKSVITEQVSLYISEGMLFSFQEREEDLFIKIRERLSKNKGRVRKERSDYLAYTLIDNIVDNYFSAMDAIQEEIEFLEYKVSNEPQEEVKGEILNLKQELIKVRKAIYPLREALSQLAKTNSELFFNETQIYVRDVHDHTIQVMDMVDTSRDILGGLQDLFISEISFRMNKVMQFLAVVTTIFVPLSFLAGLYGMNFKNMPELQSEYGYFVLLAVMFLVLLGLLIYFKRKKWF